MNAKQLLTRMQKIKSNYSTDLQSPLYMEEKRNESLALELAIVAEEVGKMNGSSRIEPVYKQAAEIYEELYQAVGESPSSETLSINLPRSIR